MSDNESGRQAAPKTCVYGAGAIGSYLAGALARAGAHVSIVSRGPHLLAIRSNGLRVQTADDTWHSQPAASDDPAALGPQDVVFVTVKAPALASVAANIGPLLGKDTLVVFVMNGIPWWYFHGMPGELNDQRLPLVDPGDAMWNAVGPQRVIGSVIYAACSVVEPGVVHLDNPGTGIVLGEPGNVVTPRVERLAQTLSAGGLKVRTTDSIRHGIWEKLLNNLASGPLGILAACPANELYADETIVGTIRALREEGAAIARAMGCDVDPDVERHIERFRNLHHKASIVQDLELGRPMEIDALYTVPLRLARKANVPTPNLDLLVALATLRAKSAGLYPTR